MKYAKEINQALKITLVYAVITSTFALLEKLSSFVPIGAYNISIENFFKQNMIWIICIPLIILGLCIYIKKSDGKLDLRFLNNPTIRLTSGFLIIFDGVINLLNKAYVLICNIQTFHQASSFAENTNVIIRNIMILNVIRISASLLQILLGLFFVFYKKKKSEL